jgi:hypothetical protein
MYEIVFSANLSISPAIECLASSRSRSTRDSSRRRPVAISARPDGVSAYTRSPSRSRRVPSVTSITAGPALSRTGIPALHSRRGPRFG